MINEKEFLSILIASLVIGLGLGIRTFQRIPLLVGLVLGVILVNVLAKKIIGYYFDTKTEVNLWEMRRYGFAPHRYFKQPFKAGAFVPLITAILSFGYFVWMAALTLDIKSSVHRSSRRFNTYSFSEVSEWHMALIVAAGIFANLIFAVIGYLIGFTEFAALNIYYAFFNIIPFSDLDGNKLFFGSVILWAFTSAVALIALGYAFFLI